MNKLYIVQSVEFTAKSKELIGVITRKFDCLKNIEIIYTPEYVYEGYDQDLNSLKYHLAEMAEIIDTRELEKISHLYSQPTRLKLYDHFFNSSQEEKEEIFLHEIGHYLTNPKLTKIRKFIAKENPKLLQSNHQSLKNICDFHNEGLKYVFQILKLSQEVNAEMWVYENQPEYSYNRLKRFCDSVVEFSKMDTKNMPERIFFFSIHRLFFQLLWSSAIIQNLELDYKIEYEEAIEVSFENLYDLSCRIGYENLKIFKMRNTILESLRYRDESIETQINNYKLIFEEYIRESSKFFPPEDLNIFLNYYELS